MTQEIVKHLEEIQNGEVPEGYKQTKAGIIPKDWEVLRLKDKFDRLSRKNAEGNTNVLTISAQYGLINQEEFFKKEIASDDKSNYYLLHRGEFAYNKSYSNGYPFGAIKRLSRYDKGVVSPLYICFSANNNNACPEYYEQYFEAGRLNHEIQAYAQEGARNHGLLNISVIDFFNSKIIVPPIAEQKRIAKILSAQDKVIECYEKKIEQLKRMKKYYLQNMFPKRGETVPKIRFKGFPDPWEQQKLADIYQKIGNAFVGTATPYYVKNGHFYLESNNVKDGQINYTTKVFINDEFYENQKDKWLHTGDIVMVQSGHVGHAAVIPKELDNTAAHALIMFRNPKTKIEPYFLNYQYQTNNAKKKIESITTGNTIKHILASDMQEFVVDVTSYEEQSNIVGVFQRLDTLITLHQRKLEEEKKKKKALQQLLLTGIVRTN